MRINFRYYDNDELTVLFEDSVYGTNELWKIDLAEQKCKCINTREKAKDQKNEITCPVLKSMIFEILSQNGGWSKWFVKELDEEYEKLLKQLTEININYSVVSDGYMKDNANNDTVPEPWP